MPKLQKNAKQERKGTQRGANQGDSARGADRVQIEQINDKQNQTRPHTQKRLFGRPRICETVQELEERCEEYFQSLKPYPLTVIAPDGSEIVAMDRNGNPIIEKPRPSVTGLALFLGYADRVSLNDIADRNDGEYSIVLKRARALVAQAHEENFFNSGCTGSIFFAKNHGWRDVQEQEHSMGKSLSDVLQRIRNGESNGSAN